MRHPLTSVLVRPLEAAAFARYGGIIEASSQAGAANQGTARRRDRVVDLRGDRLDAPLNVAVFRCAPRVLPVELRLLEKHPRSTQAFVPMNASRYLVVVAEGGGAPDLDTLGVFVAGGRQGIAYHPGIWHHPMLALDHETDFLCLVHENGGADDCVEHALATPIHVDLEGAREVAT